ncbi:ribonuclease HI family protein [Candidatus Roizmanbacteria bacterium]|nr:ribonuclease HI family protein [Candidatus Roizmanbacteria bacterium]
MEFKIYTDGGSLNNPGEAASAFLIFEDNVLIYEEGRRIGIASNNIAEYSALVFALEKVKKLLSEGKKPNFIRVFSDSSLMVNQVNGLFKVKDPNIGRKVFEVHALEQEINIPISYTHVLRNYNALADALVKKALKGV